MPRIQATSRNPQQQLPRKQNALLPDRNSLDPDRTSSSSKHNRTPNAHTISLLHPPTNPIHPYHAKLPEASTQTSIPHSSPNNLMKPASNHQTGMMPEQTPNPNTNPARLKIWQQNLNTSMAARESLLNNPQASDWNVISIQEPYINFLRNTRANHKWHILYPMHHYTHPQKRSRVVTLINAKIDTNSWTQIDFPSSDVIIL
ncbi:hypothetical protein DFH29DRAFT_994162 [Suillus ampliporus]|nr:hypothetical protein DFH29DRAFT_994162 [Suillus ampliporus]